MEWYKLLLLLLVNKLLLEVTVVPNLSCRFVNNYYEEVRSHHLNHKIFLDNTDYFGAHRMELTFALNSRTLVEPNIVQP